MTIHKNNKIISNFYLIKEDNNPVYVGYTNRPVKQRFREHIKEKDFAGDATVEELDILSFPFTWDSNIINQYAQEVSDRETSLIAEYGTDDSIWQKGTSGRVGGQTWNDIKHFVNTNRDNPKFAGVEEEDIIELIAYQKKVKQELQSVIGNTMSEETQRLKSVIGNTSPKETRRLKHIIGHTIYNDNQQLKDVIGNTMSEETQRLKSVIGITIPKETQRLKHIVGLIIPKETQRLKSVIGHTKHKEYIILHSIVGNTQPTETRRLKHVIGHTIPKETQQLKNIVSLTIPKETQRLKSVIKNTLIHNS